MAEDGGVPTRAVLDGAAEAVVVVDETGEVTYCTDDAAAVLGTDEPIGELLGTRLGERVATAVTDRKERTVEYRPGDRWYEVRVQPLETETVVYARDVTERKRRETELARSEQVLEALAANTAEAIYVKGVDGEYQFLNEAAAELFGLTPAEAIGRTDEELFGPETGAEISELDRAVIETGEPASTETTREIDGEEHTFLTEKSPFYENGEPAGIVGISRDITDRKQRERRLRRQNDRLDEFASVISHDLRNPLSVAQGRLELLARDVDHESIPEIADALDRIEGIVTDTLTLARRGDRVAETEPVPLRPLVETCWEMVETGAARVDVEATETMLADRDRARQIFENLFRNAIDHGGSAVTVRVGRDGDTLYVADDGPGIDPTDRDRIFEPGHAAADDTTGFGLTIVRRIADAHGWNVRVVDSADGGARFEFSGVRWADGSSSGDDSPSAGDDSSVGDDDGRSSETA